jgi:uncharacterized membrane protein HdeD (DUF308 family)
MENISSYNDGNQIRNVNKYRKYFGSISIITGIILSTITLSANGLVIIPLVIGGYLIVNGLMNLKKIKIDF